MVVAFEDFDSIVLNSSDLPVDRSVNLSIVFVPNVTFQILQESDVDDVDIYFPATVFSNSNVSIITFNYSLHDGLFFNNRSFSESFLISNNLSNDTITYTLFFNISFDEERVNVSHDYFLQLEDGVGGTLNVTRNMLPDTRSYSFRVRGLAGEVANVSCSGWFDCPLNITFGNDNLSRLVLNVTIPDVAVGEYQQNISFIGNNNTKTSYWHFIIRAPEYVFEEYVLAPECYVVAEDNVIAIKVSCYEDSIDYQYAQQKEFLNDLQENFKCPESVNTTVTEYVFASELSEDDERSFSRCIFDRDEYKSSWDSCKSILKTTEDALSGCNTDLTYARIDMINATERYSMDKIKSYEEAVKTIKKANRRRIWTVIGICSFFVLGISVYFLIRRLNKRRFGKW